MQPERTQRQSDSDEHARRHRLRGMVQFLWQSALLALGLVLLLVLVWLSGHLAAR